LPGARAVVPDLTSSGQAAESKHADRADIGDGDRGAVVVLQPGQGGDRWFGERQGRPGQRRWRNGECHQMKFPMPSVYRGLTTALVINAEHWIAPAKVASPAVTESRLVLRAVVAAVTVAAVHVIDAGPALLMFTMDVVWTLRPVESMVTVLVAVLICTDGGVVFSWTLTRPQGPAASLMLLEPAESSSVTVCWVDLISIFLGV